MDATASSQGTFSLMQYVSTTDMVLTGMLVLMLLVFFVRVRMCVCVCVCVCVQESILY
jgi:hypothetical protein